MGRKREGSGRRRAALGHEEPFRTCVACRASRRREEMLRFGRAPDGGVGFDVRARLPGRGAWTCADARCVRKAVDKGGFERAFEAPVIAAADVLVAAVLRALDGEVLSALGLLRRAGTLGVGRDEAVGAAGGAIALVLGSDLSPRSREEVAERAPGALLLDGPAMAQIGAAVGREPTGVLAVPRGDRGARLVEDLRRRSSFLSTIEPR